MKICDNIKKRKCLITVQGPLQFMAAIIAMEWYEKVKCNVTELDTVLLIYDLGVPEAFEQDMYQSIIDLSSIRDWSRIIFINSSEMRKISYNRYPKSLIELTKLIGNLNFDTVYLARNYGSEGSPRIMDAYPGAIHIEYGDSLGLVGNQEAFKISLKYLLTHPNIALKAFVKKMVWGYSRNGLKFYAAVLTLPIDWSGSYLKNARLIIPSHEHVKEIIDRMINQLPTLSNYCKSLVNDKRGSVNLYLLSNLTNSGVTEFDNEVALYESVILNTAIEGNTVILKNHPRASSVILDHLIDKLGDKFNVIVIDSFTMWPIELWKPLLDNCKTYPIFSTSAINIKYLYSQHVYIPLDDVKLKKYINPEWVSYMSKANNMIINALNMLDSWDENSPVLNI